MDQDQLTKRLMTTFLEELGEHVQAFNRDLLALKKDSTGTSRPDRLKSLFRSAHSLKGAARSVGVGVIGSACHHLEEILTAVQDGRTDFTTDLFALLFAATDAIEEAGMRLREQADLTEAPLAALLSRLGTAAGEAAQRPAPPSADRTPRGGSPPRELPGTGRGDGRTATPLLPPTEAVPDTAGMTATVRVAAQKLDALLAHSGELLVARKRVQSRSGELAALRESLGRWKAEWQAVEKPLQKFLQENGDAPGQEVPERNGAGRLRRLPRRMVQALNHIGRNLRQLDKDLERLTARVAADGRLFDQVGSALDDEVRGVRMLPFHEACRGLERMVHDLAQAGGKEVELAIEGGEVELDRSVLEGLKDPLRHLVRNAVDHGTEPSAERREAGKPSRARVTVAAVLRGAAVEVVVADDGRGLDLEALRREVRKRRLPEPADDRELARLAFLPGLSTAGLVTDVSGRGIGLDVVKSRVEALHGTVDIAFQPGRGTTFTIAVPLTLTTQRALLVAAAGQTFALVGTSIQRLLKIDPAELRSIGGREMLALNGVPVPVAELADVLGLESRNGTAPGSKLRAVIVCAGERRVACVVDEFLTEQEILIKNLGRRVQRLRHVTGATILPSGQIVLVLNAAGLVRTALMRGRRFTPAAVPAPPSKKRLLVAEDSVTTRTLMKSILEAAGFEVTAAVDGADAWRLLQERGADLLVSDVDMPRMNGFALTEAVRGSDRFPELPVILVTAKETDRDKARGIEVGASAYLVKSTFDQRNLLETIAQLL